MLALVWSACSVEEPGSTVRSAEVAACLEPPTDAPTAAGEEQEFLVDGEAIALQNAAAGDVFTYGIRCDRVVRVVTIEDDAGNDWRIGYGWSEAGHDVTPDLDLLPNAQVSFVFRDLESAGEASGFVLRQQGRLVATLEVGAWGPALDLPIDLPDVVVGEGSVTGTAPDPCGKKVARELRFVADESVYVEAIGSEFLNVEGQLTEVWALASWGIDDPTCPDVSGELSWAVWREP